MTPDAMPDPRPSVMTSAAARAARYLEGLDKRPVAPLPSAIAELKKLGGPLPEAPTAPLDVVRLLDEYASPATVASAGPRYFGFVTGGALPAALGAAVLAAAWDQNAALEVMSPAAAALEDVAAGWIIDLLGLPARSAVGFTTGATMANLIGLAAARQTVLARAGWDVTERGLLGAPAVTVVVGEEVHVSALKALILLGFGRAGLVRVPVDGQGRMRPEAFPALESPAIVCVQAGNVNTGAFDPLGELCRRAHDAGAWVHVDGLRVGARLTRLCVAGRGRCARRFVGDRRPQVAERAVRLGAGDRQGASGAPGGDRAQRGLSRGRSKPRRLAFVPEFSRRARGVEVWAALRSLGRRGLAELVERCSRLTVRFADGMWIAGYEVLNDVVLNQALVAFGSAERTRTVIEAVQQEGTCWCGGTVWQGRTAMRFSVSSWATTEADIYRVIAAVRDLAASA
jgi:glutamate/tyrosine decarboxylase-like PLP-dependent enzyme